MILTVTMEMLLIYHYQNMIMAGLTNLLPIMCTQNEKKITITASYIAPKNNGALEVFNKGCFL